MLRVALALLLALAACATTPADPVALLDQWRDAIRLQKSVRFNVEIKVEGNDPRLRTFAGVQHIDTGGGATTQQDVTAHNESRWGVTDYRAVTLGNDTYLQHTEVTLPPGKTFVRMELNSGVGAYVTSLSLDEQQYHPGNLFGDIDRKTVRLVEQTDNRYVFNAGGVPHSGGYQEGPVRLVVEVDDEDRVVRVEQSAPSVDRQKEHITATYSQWGTAPDVLRPPAEHVAKPAEVVVRER